MNKPGLTPTEQNLQLMPWSAPRETLRTAERESPDIRPARMRSAFHQRHIHSHGRWKEHGKSTNCCRLAVRPLPRPAARGEARRKPPQSKSQKFLFSFDGFRLDNQKCHSKCYAPRRILHLSTGNSSCKRSAAERGLALARSAALESARSGHRLQRRTGRVRRSRNRGRADDARRERAAPGDGILYAGGRYAHRLNQRDWSGSTLSLLWTACHQPLPRVPHTSISTRGCPNPTTRGMQLLPVL